MKWTTKMQEGSPARDRFKLLHKHYLPKACYATDADLILIGRNPIPHVIACLDFKTKADSITFAEVVAYNALLNANMPVFIVETDCQSADAFISTDPKEHSFTVYRYLGGDPYPEPPKVQLQTVSQGLSWSQLALWEEELRERTKGDLERRLMEEGIRFGT